MGEKEEQSTVFITKRNEEIKRDHARDSIVCTAIQGTGVTRLRSIRTMIVLTRH
jgi:hypothetical protein